MTGIQEKIHYALGSLQDAVKNGDFGIGDDFDKHQFEAEFDDEVLIICYVYE